VKEVAKPAKVPAKVAKEVKQSSSVQDEVKVPAKVPAKQSSEVKVPAVVATKSECKPSVEVKEVKAEAKAEEVKEVKEVKAAWRSSLEVNLEAFWASHTIEEVWETKVPTLTRVPKRLVGPLSSAFLSVLGHRLYKWQSDEAHAAEALFCKCVLRTLPPADKSLRPIDVLRRRLEDWTVGRFEECGRQQRRQLRRVLRPRRRRRPGSRRRAWRLWSRTSTCRRR
jgi:hypothetical protein